MRCLWGRWLHGTSWSLEPSVSWPVGSLAGAVRVWWWHCSPSCSSPWRTVPLFSGLPQQLFGGSCWNYPTLWRRTLLGVAQLLDVSRAACDIPTKKSRGVVSFRGHGVDVWSPSKLVVDCHFKVFSFISLLNVYRVRSTRMMKKIVICLVNVLFCSTYWNIRIFSTNNKETNMSCACFLCASTSSGRMFDLVCMLKASTGLVCLFAICSTFVYTSIPICNTKQYFYQTKYAVLYHSGTYNNVYIGIGSTCM